MTVTNTSSVRHRYHMFGAFYEHGAFRRQCLRNRVLRPGHTATCKIINATFQNRGHHGVGVAFHVGLVDDSTGEGNLRLSITVLTSDSISSQTFAEATY